MSKVTIFGAGGFIGSAILSELEKEGFDVKRGDWRNPCFNESLGYVIYCCGYGNCNDIDAVYYSHVDLIRKIINESEYDHLCYISSTRLFLGNDTGSEEADFKILENDKRKLFNLSKLNGEFFVQSQSKPYIILRPSNVYGKSFKSNLFLPSLVRDAICKNTINLFVDENYSKDYLYIKDLVFIVRQSINLKLTGSYNVASGENVDAKTICSLIQKKTNCQVVWHENDCDDFYPIIDISKIQAAINYKPSSVKDLVNEMVDEFKVKFSNK